jgi:hypothetical protein
VGCAPPLFSSVLFSFSFLSESRRKWIDSFYQRQTCHIPAALFTPQ